MKDSKIGKISNNSKGTPMKIVGYRNNDDLDVEFLDDFHYVKKHQTYSNFRRGVIKNPYDKTICGIGYIGVGKYPVSINKKLTVEYQNWTCMLRRCYDEKLKEKYPTYFNKCTVCDEWHNFQNFAKWYNENIYQVGTERMHIDKDIRCNNNKIYSPETCLIVPQRINMLFKEKSNKYNLHNGITKLSNGKFKASYNNKNLGVFDTLELGIEAYIYEKCNAVKNIANEYKDKIPKELFDALINIDLIGEYT